MHRIAPSLRFLALLLALTLVAGCKGGLGGLFKKDNDPLETLPVEEMYAEAKGSLQRGNVERAERYYRRLVGRFPYGPYTEQSQLELAYAQFKGKDYDDASSTINRFIRTYPTHRHIDYAYYLRGVINFRRDLTVFDRLARLDATRRDLGNLRQSFNDFAELIRRYPNSRYAPDARQRMVYLRNQLARYEINVAQYYLQRRAYVAAINRAKHLMENYPESAYVGDSLAVMTLSYERLGQDDLAADARRVLELNHPQHPYFAGGWPRERAWWRKLVPLSGEEQPPGDKDS
ncbi:MAG TPA: outer membrane protein assembly factor BamD [Xanthomonadaceae bacterium]|nr:outer membrane protein assembly factor BamD [Xanthomonadaceae bacterium]